MTRSLVVLHVQHGSNSGRNVLLDLWFSFLIPLSRKDVEKNCLGCGKQRQDNPAGEDEQHIWTQLMKGGGCQSRHLHSQVRILEMESLFFQGTSKVWEVSGFFVFLINSNTITSDMWPLLVLFSDFPGFLSLCYFVFQAKCWYFPLIQGGALLLGH